MATTNDIQKTVVCPNCQINSNVLYLNSDKFNIYFCKTCQNGFLNPVPKNMDDYYPAGYWQFPGQLANIREGLHNLLQIRRKKWLSKYISRGKILDFGAGEGVFGKVLGDNFKVTNLESPSAKVINKDVLKLDFLKWRTKEKFNGIVFLESLEHVSSPQDYLKKASSLLKKGGYILIECPRFDCIESKFFGKYWLHLDLPRHLSHLTEKGITILAKRCGLVKVSQGGVMLYEFSPYCFLVSLMLLLKIKPLNLREKSFSNFIPLSFIVLFFPIALLAETFFYYLKQAPIELSIFRK